MTEPRQPTFAPGDHVVLETTGEPELGVVVHCWWSPEIDAEDCYVVVFGAAFPTPGAAPDGVPYVLRYAASSLRRVA